MTDAVSELLTRAHKTISDGAATSKRSISAHQRMLKEQKKVLEEIELEANRLGLEIHHEPTNAEYQEVKGK